MTTKKILFLTTTSLATNPRCLKEIKLAVELNFQVSVVKFGFKTWAEKLEKKIEKELSCVKFYSISAEREPILPWFTSTLVHRIAKLLYSSFARSPYILALALDKRSWLLIRFLKKKKLVPDLIIAHNPGSFYPAYLLCKKQKLPLGVDVEDFHPGETEDNKRYQRMLDLMKVVLPKSSYISFASPLIKDYTLKAVPSLANTTIINNCFPRDEFLIPESIEKEKPLMLVWYSQNIDFNRGIEKLLPVVQKFAGKVRVTLIGNLREGFKNYLKDFREVVQVVEPLHQKTLHQSLPDYDIGLAIEPGRDLNNNIALSNKIWSYFQAGCFILASKTAAQEKFIHQFPEAGILFNIHDENSISDSIQYLLKHLQEIRGTNKKRFSMAQHHSWEIECLKLQRQWQSYCPAT